MPLGLVIISWIRTESTSHKSKISWDYMALKSFCTAKEALHSAKDNPQNGRKYLQMKQLIKD